MSHSKTRSWPLWLILLTGCASVALQNYDADLLFGQSVTVERRAAFHSEQARFFREQVKPILDQRCVVCHACNDAPCQLKLTSAEGIMRGANANNVYNGSRLIADDLNRLGLDASTPEQWRQTVSYTPLNLPYNTKISSTGHALPPSQHHNTPEQRIHSSSHS